MQKIEIHPFAKVWPAMDKARFNALKKDIKANGLRRRLTLYDGKILDGRSRFEACAAIDREMAPGDFEEAPIAAGATDDEILNLCISLNEHRRHMTPTQSAVAAAKIEILRRKMVTEAPSNGAPAPAAKGKKAAKGAGKAAAAAAAVTGASVRSTERAIGIAEKFPALFKQAESGEKTIGAIDQEIKTKAGKPRVPRGPRNEPTEKPEPKDDRVAKWYAAYKPLLDLRQRIQEIIEDYDAVDGAVRVHSSDQSFKSHLQAAKQELWFAAPDAVCPYCAGNGCKACQNVGWITARMWENVPKEVKLKAGADRKAARAGKGDAE